MIKLSPTPSILDPILDFLRIKPDKPESTLNITKFGTFTASFNALPPPIPKEIWLSLFAISLSVIIPSILRWYNGWRQRKHFYRYLKEIDSKHNRKLNLKALNDEISELYAKGKINESQHKILSEKASASYDNDDAKN